MGDREALKDFRPPKSASDVADLLAHSLIEVREGKADPKLANSISYLGTALLRALEVADLEKRVQALEAGSEHQIRSAATTLGDTSMTSHLSNQKLASATTRRLLW